MRECSAPAGGASSPDDSDRLAYFAALYAGFRRAEEAMGGALSRYYAIGGATICLRFAGPAWLAQVAPAFAHLETDPTDAPALTVCLWDSVSTRVKLPLLIASLIHLLRLTWWEQLDGRREIRAYSSPRMRTTFRLGPDILSAFDPAASLAVYWLPDAHRIPYYERAYPLQTVLNWWAERSGRHYLHAAAVGTPAGGVLLAGKGGSGKSTTTLACLASELGVVSDDYTLVAGEPLPYAYSLYNTAKLRTRDDMGKFPLLLARLSNPDQLDEEKAMIFLHAHYPQKILRGFPIRAILLPQVRDQTATHLEPASAAAAPSTMLQLPSSGQSALQAMARLVRALPCYHLALGTDLAQIPAVISRLLGGLA